MEIEEIKDELLEKVVDQETLYNKEVVDQEALYNKQGLEILQKALNQLSENETKHPIVVDEESALPQDGENKEEESVEKELPSKDIQRKKELYWTNKEKYKLIDEKEAALNQVKELQDLLNQAVTSGTYHYSKSAYNDLERAKIAKKIALESGDTDGLIEADEGIYNALDTIRELEKRSYTPASAPPQTQSREAMRNAIARDWIESHAELNPKSRNYNEDVAEDVYQYIKKLDRALYLEGNQDMLFSSQYFEAIDDHVNELKRDVNSRSPKTGPVSRQVQVGAVRNAGNGAKQVSSLSQVKLTPDEVYYCEQMGIPQKNWIYRKYLNLTGEK